MKYVLFLMLLFFMSCSEDSMINEILKNKTFVEGNEWQYFVTKNNNPQGTLELVTIKDTLIEGDKEQLVNKWVYSESDSLGNNKNTRTSVSEILFYKADLTFPPIDNNVSSLILPHLQVDSTLKIGKANEKNLSMKLTFGKSMEYDIDGNLIDSALEDNDTENVEKIDYDYDFKYLGKVFDDNKLVMDSCQHYRLDFIYKQAGNQHDNKHFLIDYYFHDKFAYTYIKLSIDDTTSYIVTVSGFNSK